MPSVLHEVIVSLFTDRPQLATELWAAARLNPPLPLHDGIERGKVNLSQETTAAYEADEMAVLTVGATPQLVLIIEVQLKIDEGKTFSWPGYVTGARTRRRCEAVVMVITPRPAVARWARRPVHLGGGNWFTPTVIGPESIPLITSDALAAGNPELALLSVIAHGRGPHAEALAEAATGGLDGLDPARHKLYTDMVLSHLARRAQEAFFDMLDIKNYEWQSDWVKHFIAEGRAKGVAEGRAKGVAEGETQGARAKAQETLKKQLRLKFRELSAEHEAFIDAADLDALDEALLRVLTEDNAAAVLGLPSDL